MTARTHDTAAFGTLLFVVVLGDFTNISFATLIWSLVAVLFGGIAPDIDQPTAPLWHNLPVGKYLGKVFDRLSGGHRFITHSLLGLAIFGFLLHWLLSVLRPIMGSVRPDYVWWSFMIGFASHLVMDSFTKEGVPWLLPIPIKFGFPPLKKLRVKTGGVSEKFVIFPLLVIGILYLVNIHSLFLRQLLRGLR